MSGEFGSRVTRGGRTPTPSIQLGDPLVPWSAKLVQPDRMSTSSAQELVLDITSPQILDGTAEASCERTDGRERIAVRLAWQGDVGQRRRAVGTIARPPVGIYRVFFVFGGARIFAGPINVV